MNRSLVLVAIGLASLLAVGCDDDPVTTPIPPDLAGEWTLVSTVVAKLACVGSEPNDFVIEPVHISQENEEATLAFADYSVSGVFVRGVLTAQGTMPGGESLRLKLSSSREGLEGTAQISGASCQEQRTVVARRREADANFSGHWSFQLTVVGEDGCSHIADYEDCFRIIQSGTDLLVVDDEAGNLAGQVTGSVAQIRRDTATEVTSLLFFLDAAANRLTGTAIRVFPELDCRTVLDFVGSLRSEPCADVVP